MKIPEITINPFHAFGDEEMEKEFDRQEKAANEAWENVYNLISGRAQDLAYWDGISVERPGYRSFVRYALHHSPKRDGYLQLSTMEIRNGGGDPMQR